MKIETKLFSQTLINGAVNYPDRPAVTCRDKTVTYGMLKLAADHCTVKLLSAGFKKGDKAILWGFNGIEWMVSFSESFRQAVRHP